MKNINKIILLVLWVFFAAPLSGVFGQESPPVLVSNVGGKKQPLELTKLSIDVAVSGFIAETRMTMTFYNPHDRELEGELHFPLPEGAFVSGYALDINGKMVDGVVVEKEKARVVFEEIVRRGVDPGLVEWVKGNNFKTRVYPIFKHNSRTVMVRFLSELIRRNGKVYYQLPLTYNRRVKEFSLRMRMGKPGTNNENGNGNSDNDNGFANFRLKDWRTQTVSKITKKDFLLKEDLVIPLPAVEAQAVSVEAAPDGQYYFSIHDLEAAAGKKEKSRAAAPKRIAILWDASSSRGGVKKELELELLKNYFARAHRRRIKVELFAFNVEKTRVGKFIVSEGNAETLIRAIRALNYDGGTAMSAISPIRKEKKPGFYFLFSDGNHSFGKEESNGFKAPVYVFSSSSIANHAFLRHLAHRTGGEYFNLTRRAPGDVAEAIGRSPYMFISATASRGSVTETFPSSPHPVRGIIAVAGKLTGETAQVTLNYGVNKKIMKRVTLTLSRREAVKGTVLRTFWAQKKVGELMAFPRENRLALVETGKTYGLVTPGTSLIVLERLNDYIGYKIKPPESLPEMRKQYEKHVAKYKEDVRDNRKGRLERVIRDWVSQVKWWSTDFPPPKPRKPKVKKSTGTQSGANPQPTRQPVQPRRNPPLDRPVATNAGKGNGSLSGTIVIEDGSRIPGVMVDLTATGGAVQLRGISTESGAYRFIGLPAGTYQLRFSLEGLNTTTWEDIRLAAGQHLQLRPSMLTLGALREEIVVSGEAPTVDRRSTFSMSSGADTSDNSYNIDGVSMNDPGLNRFLNTTSPAATVSIKPWDPKTPYMKKIKTGNPGSSYARYLEQKAQYGNTPGFYLDCAGYFAKTGRKKTALLVLSNIAEIQLENAFFLRVLAGKLSQLGYLELSEGIFRQVKELRPEEPQSYRDLALVLERSGQYRSAAQLLYDVVLGDWDDRFDGIEMIALMELNHVLATARRKGENVESFGIDPRLVKLLDVDIRIVLTWDSDMTDMDLWVIEPGGEKVSYSHKRSRIGGHLSNDFTDGMGPEEYWVKRAIHGKYQVEVEYYGSDSAKLAAPVTLHVDVFTHWGRKNEKRRSMTLQLGNKDDDYLVGEIDF
ncbi:MAG: DUF2135 domain-containing protein [bacterium]|nr:DUF2135 domain-containing protein [bacterium]